MNRERWFLRFCMGEMEYFWVEDLSRIAKVLIEKNIAYNIIGFIKVEMLELFFMLCRSKRQVLKLSCQGFMPTHAKEDVGFYFLDIKYA